jgi:hypothetical protein
MGRRRCDPIVDDFGSATGTCALAHRSWDAFVFQRSFTQHHAAAACAVMLLALAMTLDQRRVLFLPVAVFATGLLSVW